MIKEKLIKAMLLALMTIIVGIVCGSIFILIGTILPDYPIAFCIVTCILLFLCFTCLFYNDKE